MSVQQDGPQTGAAPGLPRLIPVADEVWIAEGPIVDFYGFPYSTRMVLVRLPSGALWIWSPVARDPDLAAEVAALGPVAHLVSPNKIHHLFLSDWQQACPGARLWGPASTIAKRSDLRFEKALEDSAPPDWEGVIDQAWFRGSPLMDEIVFFHRPSRTAIFADLIEAFDEAFLQAHWSWWQRQLARIDGVTAACPHAPGEWRLSFLDRAPARAARDRVLGWEPERVTIAHGTWCRTGGTAFVTGALAWLGETPAPGTGSPGGLQG